MPWRSFTLRESRKKRKLYQDTQFKIGEILVKGTSPVKAKRQLQAYINTCKRKMEKDPAYRLALKKFKIAKELI